MDFIRYDIFEKKAKDLLKPLIHTKAFPISTVSIIDDSTAFQGLRAIPAERISIPLRMDSNDSVILDFGNHFVGYLNFSLNHYEKHITDSPIILRFTFAEKPLELLTFSEKHVGTVAYSWIQEETKRIPFTPCQVRLERRYAFRYLKIERIDAGKFPICFTDLYADTVSSVSLCDASSPNIIDPMLESIYKISLNTLKECEQEVFEDGPKRDRRLWIGDLRLQALADYVSFNNVDLIKRCIYLFAAYREEQGFVASCVFPDSPPYVDTWHLTDYSMFFISCLFDFAHNVDDVDFIKEMFPTAKEQFRLVSAMLDRKNKRFSPQAGSHIDWCPGIDKSLPLLGIYVYTLKQLWWLAEYLNESTDEIENEITVASEFLRSYYSSEKHLFIAASGQISWQSQIFAVLANVLTTEQNNGVLNAIEQNDTSFNIRSPYMMHYYIDALWSLGEKEKAIKKIKEYWSVFVNYGFDCCPELYSSDDHFLSPFFNAPEVDSMCHAWSCTPVYWLHRYYNER